MIIAFGESIEVIDYEQCTMSATNHRTLLHQARVERIKRGFDVDESFVVCTSCRKAISLKI